MKFKEGKIPEKNRAPVSCTIKIPAVVLDALRAEVARRKQAGQSRDSLNAVVNEAVLESPIVKAWTAAKGEKQG
jgi:hypothetical protein